MTELPELRRLVDKVKELREHNLIFYKSSADVNTYLEDEIDAALAAVRLAALERVVAAARHVVVQVDAQDWDAETDVEELRQSLAALDGAGEKSEGRAAL